MKISKFLESELLQLIIKCICDLCILLYNIIIKAHILLINNPKHLQPKSPHVLSTKI